MNTYLFTFTFLAKHDATRIIRCSYNVSSSCTLSASFGYCKGPTIYKCSFIFQNHPAQKVKPAKQPPVDDRCPVHPKKQRCAEAGKAKVHHDPKPRSL